MAHEEKLAKAYKALQFARKVHYVHSECRRARQEVEPLVFLFDKVVTGKEKAQHIKEHGFSEEDYRWGVDYTKEYVKGKVVNAILNHKVKLFTG